MRKAWVAATIIAAMCLAGPARSLLAADDPTGPTAEFLRGDVNRDGRVSMADVIYLRRYLFLGAEPPVCFDAVDASDDGVVDLKDAIHIIRAIMEGVILPEPFPLPGLDPTEDGYTCGPAEIVPGEFTDDLLRVADVEAAPGEDVLVPIYLTASVGVQGYQLVIAYDPDVFQPYPGLVGAPDAGLVVEGSTYVNLYEDHPHYINIRVVEEDRYFVIGVVGSFIEANPLPVGEENLLLQVRGHVPSSVLAGTESSLEPTNGPDDEGVGLTLLRNEITSLGQARYVAFYPKTKEGKLSIKDNPMGMDYILCDANVDGSVNIADPIFLLTYLFNEGPAPLCPDAADTDDSGDLGIGDAILTLTYLFVDTNTESPLASQFGMCTNDVTYDTLGPCTYGFCKSK